MIFAFDDTGKQVGSLRYSLAEEADGTRWNPEVHVTEAARRKGIATAMYDLAEATGGKIPKESQAGQVRSGDGAAFRKARGTSTGETAFAGTAPPAGAGRGVEVLARDGGDLPSKLRITDGGKATTIDVLARDAGEFHHHHDAGGGGGAIFFRGGGLVGLDRIGQRHRIHGFRGHDLPDAREFCLAIGVGRESLLTGIRF